MYLSTLRSHIEAKCGELDLIARFPGGSVKINNFAELGAANPLTPSLLPAAQGCLEVIGRRPSDGLTRP